MHRFDTAGQGSALKAGTRPGGNSANGNAVMYDTGKILACGGSEAFAEQDYPATTEASIISINEPNTQPQVSSSYFRVWCRRFGMKPINDDWARGCQPWVILV